jgi:trimethylamine--corrinoid protein Co-methyltransferase
MAILRDVGVGFNSQQALEIFKSHGFKTDGKLVFATESQVEAALKTAPSEFTISARNPAHNLTIGNKTQVALAPGYGAPFIMESYGDRRRSTIEDYRAFCKLTQTSDVINMNGFLMVDPSDLDPGTYHLDMLYDSITFCDKPFMGSPLSRTAALDAIHMADIVFGNCHQPVTVANINALAPLQFADEMAEALLVFAEHRQPVIIMGGGILGSTTPIRVAGLLAIQNASVLAGLTLTQLINPGVPVIYGVAGSPLDMQTGAYYIAGPEFSIILEAGTAMAKFYRLPCRGGGALTDSHALDFQAGYQSALLLDLALKIGVDFVLHACGILGTFMAMSPEKFVIDEELCRHSLTARSNPEISDATIDLRTIAEVGVGGEFLTHRTTLELCRQEIVRLPLSNRLAYEEWNALETPAYKDKAALMVAQRLEKYQRPDIEPEVEKELSRYVKERKTGKR